MYHNKSCHLKVGTTVCCVAMWELTPVSKFCRWDNQELRDTWREQSHLLCWPLNTLLGLCKHLLFQMKFNLTRNYCNWYVCITDGIQINMSLKPNNTQKQKDWRIHHTHAASWNLPNCNVVLCYTQVQASKHHFKNRNSVDAIYPCFAVLSFCVKLGFVKLILN